MHYKRRKDDSGSPYTRALGMILAGSVTIGYILKSGDEITKNDLIYAGIVMVGGIVLLWPKEMLTLFKTLVSKLPFGSKPSSDA